MSARLFIVLAFASVAVAQPQVFETASVKAVPGAQRARPRMAGGPGTTDPSRIQFSNVTLETLLLRAYEVRQFQLSTPDWMSTDRFEIVATLPPATTEAQFRVMLQDLLARRFGLASHRENQEMAGLLLSVAKGGFKLKPAAQVVTDANAAPTAAVPGAVALYPIGPSLHAIGKAVTIPALAEFLTKYLRQPVFDGTGVQGLFDVNVTFRSDEDASPSDDETLTTALASQCGLELKKAKQMVEMFVVDRASKVPTEN